MHEVISHYDALIDENNDPVHDPLVLRKYMDKWDGQGFIDALRLTRECDVLEIGVGTGRLAVRVCGNCGSFLGIDISPKTIEQAKVNLARFSNCELVCGDFLEYSFDGQFDVIYSSLTFMHIKAKWQAINKVADLLRPSGVFVLSISNDTDRYLNYGTRKIELYPDSRDEIETLLHRAGLCVASTFCTEFATVFAASKGREVQGS